MAEQEVDPVVASYHRCREDEKFVDTFYKIFLGKSDDVAKLFEHTDFERQKLMLRESLLEMLCFNRGAQGSEDEIHRLAKRHIDLGVKKEMYVLWLDSLCEAVQAHDPEYTPEVGQQWRNAMRKGIKLMISC